MWMWMGPSLLRAVEALPERLERREGQEGRVSFVERKRAIFAL